MTKHNIAVVGKYHIFKLLSSMLVESDQYKLIHVSKCVHNLSGYRLSGAIFLDEWRMNYSRAEQDFITGAISLRINTPVIPLSAIVMGPKSDFIILQSLISRIQGFNFQNIDTIDDMSIVLRNWSKKEFNINFYTYLKSQKDYRPVVSTRTLDIMSERI